MTWSGAHVTTSHRQRRHQGDEELQAYFETALDITYCIRSDDANQPGFYLIKVMGSEQAGLTGFKGSIVRKAAVGRSESYLQKSLTAIKDALEKKQ